MLMVSSIKRRREGQAMSARRPKAAMTVEGSGIAVIVKVLVLLLQLEVKPPLNENKPVSPMSSVKFDPKVSTFPGRKLFTVSSALGA